MTLEGQVDTGRTTHLPQMHRQVPWKTWVRVATTANGTFASAFDNGSSVDGVTLATGDRILLKNQTATEENGIYVVQASGVPFRAFDMDDIGEVQGAVVLVLAGTANAGTLWYTTSTPSVLDDDAITWTQFAGSGGGAPTTADYLVGTAQAGLSAEIVVGTSPGGELGGTWASPTVDSTHSGSAHTDFIAKSVLTTQDDIIVRDASAPARLAKGTDGQVLTVDPTTHHIVWATPSSGLVGSTQVIPFIINGAGSVIGTGIAGDLTIPFGCTIVEVTMLADQAGAVVVDIWKDVYANYPPTAFDSITASAKPTITAGNTKSQDSTLTGWTTTITAGDTLRYNVDSATTITRVLVSLKVTRS